jgi:hypothetical protein
MDIVADVARLERKIDELSERLAQLFDYIKEWRAIEVPAAACDDESSADDLIISISY